MTIRDTALAHALRSAGDAVERVRGLALHAHVRLDEQTYMTLCFDAPTVAQAFYSVAGTLDPEGEAGPCGNCADEPVGRAV